MVRNVAFLVLHLLSILTQKYVVTTVLCFFPVRGLFFCSSAGVVTGVFVLRACALSRHLTQT